MSGGVILTCTMLPTELVVHLKQRVKVVQAAPEITLMTLEGEFLCPTQSIRDAGLRNHDIVVAVLMSRRLVATAALDGIIRTFDIENNVIEREVVTAPPRSLLAANLSLDGHLLVTGSAVETPKLWNAKTGELRRKFEAHDGSVSCVDISAQGRTIASGGYDFLAKVWDVASGACLQQFVDMELPSEGGLRPRTHALPLLAVKFSPYNSQLLATTSSDCSAKLWNVQSGVRLHKFCLGSGRGTPQPVTAVCFADNGQDIITCSGGYASVWSLVTGQELRTWEAHTCPITALAHSADDAILLTGSQDGAASLWDLRGGICRRSLQGHAGPITALGLSPDGKFAVTASADGQAKVWNTKTGACDQTLLGSRMGVLMASFVPS